MDEDTVRAVAAHAEARASHEFEAVPRDEHGEPVTKRSRIVDVVIFIAAVLASLVKQGVELVLRDTRPGSYYDYYCLCSRRQPGQEPRSHKKSGDQTTSKKKNYTDTSKICDCEGRFRVAYLKKANGWKVTHLFNQHKGHFPRQFIPPKFTAQDQAVVDQWKNVHGMTMSTILSLLRMQGVITTPHQVRVPRLRGGGLVVR
jgi:hypothetical protein